MNHIQAVLDNKHYGHKVTIEKLTADEVIYKVI